MANFTYAQLEGIWLQAAQGTQYATQAWAALMAAIAEAESGGDPNSTNPTDNNGRQTSWGLWQVSNGDHSQPAPNWNNPLVNAQLAIGKLDSQGLGAWGTYNSGAYKAYISGSTTPDSSGITDATLLAATSSAQGAGAAAAAGAQSDCAWSLSWGGVLGVGSFRFCLISDSQVRGLAGIGLLVAGGLIMFSGVATIAVAAGAPLAAKLLPLGKIAGAASAGRAATRATARSETALAA